MKDVFDANLTLEEYSNLVQAGYGRTPLVVIRNPGSCPFVAIMDLAKDISVAMSTFVLLKYRDCPFGIFLFLLCYSLLQEAHRSSLFSIGRQAAGIFPVSLFISP